MQGTPHEQPWRTRATSGRRPRRQLDGPHDSRVRAPLPAPVELGLGVHRDRLLDAGTRRARRRSCAALFAGQWANGLLPHIRFAKNARYFPGPSSGGPISRRSRRRIRPRPGSCSRPSTRRPSGRSSVARRRRTTRRPSSASSSRSSPPGTSTSTASAPGVTTASSRSGIRGSRAWTTRRSGTPRSNGSRLHPTTIPDVPARRRRVRRRGPASDERPLRPLRVPREALPRPRIRDRAHPRRLSVRRAGRALQLAPRPGESRSRRDLARRSGADPEPYETWADRIAADPRAACGTRTRRRTSTTTSRAASSPIRASGGPGLAAVRRVSERRAGRALVERSALPVAIDGAGRAVASVLPTTRTSSPRWYGAGRSGR